MARRMGPEREKATLIQFPICKQSFAAQHSICTYTCDNIKSAHVHTCTDTCPRPHTCKHTHRLDTGTALEHPIDGEEYLRLARHQATAHRDDGLPPRRHEGVAAGREVRGSGGGGGWKGREIPWGSKQGQPETVSNDPAGDPATITNTNQAELHGTEGGLENVRRECQIKLFVAKNKNREQSQPWRVHNWILNEVFFRQNPKCLKLFFADLPGLAVLVPSRITKNYQAECFTVAHSRPVHECFSVCSHLGIGKRPQLGRYNTAWGLL